MDVNEYINFKEKTIAEFIVAIHKIEQTITTCIKNKDLIGAFKLYKQKIKLEQLLSQKKKDGEKNNYQTHKR